MVMTRSPYSGIKQTEIIALTQQLMSWTWSGLEAKTVLVRTGSTEEGGSKEKITRLLRAHLTLTTGQCVKTV